MKILVIGSGPIVIGQAAEFDYAGTQACKALREEGHEVVLINSNPATIMTDEETADRVYIEPLTPEFCERVIAQERPEGLLPTLGGQTGLNLASALAQRGILEKYNVKLLGTPLSAIQKAEDREEFRALMREINEPVPESWIVESPDQLEAILGVVPYPCIVRPAYTLGGTGGGIAKTREELWAIGNNGLKLSMRSQIMVERSLLGWKEVEYEVMRDSKGTCITICNMENFDPMGVHTGDSIVIAPSQTLSDIEYHMLRTASLKIIRALGIEGGCNVQLAMSPESFDYYVIEVNPRVSRSSALASKATGYPIARVAAKIAIGKTLDEIDNQVTGTTKACFEPALDYCVVKIPRWPFDKFQSGDRTLFTQMKATGEVMAIDRSFETAFMKAIRGLEVKQKDLWHEKFAGPRRVLGVSGTGGSPVSNSGVSPEEEVNGLSSTGVSPVSNSGVSPELPAKEQLPSKESPEVLSEDASSRIRQGAYMPHWEVPGGVYAVTFRLADSLPQQVWAELIEQRLHLERLIDADRPAEARSVTLLKVKELQQIAESYLDQGNGSCVLRRPEVGAVVEGAIQKFDGERYDLFAYAVMPNHVHVILKPYEERTLSEILHSWKSFTSKEINKVLGQSGQVWQPEYYDHLIKDQKEFEAQVEYVWQNPAAAGIDPAHQRRGLGKGFSNGQTEFRKVREEPAEYGSDQVLGQDAQATHGRDARATGESPFSVVREEIAGYASDQVPGQEARATGAMPDAELRDAIRIPTDERLWAIAEGLRRGWAVEEVQKLSKVDPWFLHKMRDMVAVEQALLALDQFVHEPETMTAVLERAFALGFDYAAVARLLGITGEFMADLMRLRESTAGLLQADELREELDDATENGDFEATADKMIDAFGAAMARNPEAQAANDWFWSKYDSSDPVFLTRFFAAGHLRRLSTWSVFKMVDTCAGEFESQTSYFYSTLEQESDRVTLPH